MLSADLLKAIEPFSAQKATYNLYYCLKRWLDIKHESIRERLAICQQHIGSYSIENSLGV